MLITAQMVKELREQTGAGMMDCKKALQENEGSIENSIDWLRQKGIAKAAKKSGRATSEGIVCYVSSADKKIAALGSVCCETDFVSRGEKFQNFTKLVAGTVLEKNPADIDALNSILDTELKELIGILGENMALGGFARIERKGHGGIGVYIHSNNKIGVLVDIEAEKEDTAAKQEFQDLAKNIAMQIAATNPLAVESSELDPALIAREREIYKQKAIDEGKPLNIVEKMVEGAVNKFYKENCLLEQPFIRDEKLKIKDIVANTGKALGDKITVHKFTRVQLGTE